MIKHAAIQVVDTARLGAMFSVTSGNPVLTATTIATQLQDAVTATKTLKTAAGASSHGYYGLDWATHDAASGAFTGSKGGWLPGQGAVLQFTTGGFTYALAINGNADVNVDWLTPIAASAQTQAGGAADLFQTVYGMPSLAQGAGSACGVATDAGDRERVRKHGAGPPGAVALRRAGHGARQGPGTAFAPAKPKLIHKASRIAS